MRPIGVTPSSVSYICRACAWRWARGHEGGRSSGADACEPACELDDRRRRAPVPSLRFDNNLAAQRFAPQDTRSARWRNVDDSRAPAHQAGVHSSARCARRSLSRQQGRTMTYRYRITLRPLSAAEGGGWLAEVPDLPGCMSDGDTPQEAVENVMDAMACWWNFRASSMRCVARSPCSRRCPRRNAGMGADSRIELRIGINLGDVIVEGDDLYGDGVNIAARIEALADAGGVFVSNTVHDHVRDRLPFLFEDLGEQQVKNIARPVRVYRVRDTGTATSPSAPAHPVLPLPDKPSIAVLPFANMSGDPEQEYFADGITEDIITLLAGWRAFPVIARASTFTYKGKTVDLKKVREELGVRYVVEGSVRK